MWHQLDRELVAVKFSIASKEMIMLLHYGTIGNVVAWPPCVMNSGVNVVPTPRFGIIYLFHLRTMEAAWNMHHIRMIEEEVVAKDDEL